LLVDPRLGCVTPSPPLQTTGRTDAQSP